MRLHVFPINDFLEHVVDGSSECPCNPRIEIVNGEELVIHNSWDGREYFEQHPAKNLVEL